MRAARFYQVGEPLRVEEVERPAIGRDEALVRVRAAGICHTELHFTDDGLLRPAKVPMTLGHEVAGDVAEIQGGPEGIGVGDRVVVYYYGPCGHCYWCRHGAGNLCSQLRAQLGFISDGGFAEYVKVPATSLVKLPANLSYEEGATLGCSATTAIHAMREMGKVKLGETLAVYGIGGIGLLMVQLGKLMGATVIAISRTHPKLERAKEFGADKIINAVEQDVVKEAREFTHNEGVDAVFELVGVAKSMADSIAMLRKRGRLVFVGYSPDDFKVNPIPLVVGELTVTASVGNTLQELVDVVHLAGAGKLKPTVGATFPLTEINNALDIVRQGKVIGRAVVVP